MQASASKRKRATNVAITGITELANYNIDLMYQVELSVGSAGQKGRARVQGTFEHTARDGAGFPMVCARGSDACLTADHDAFVNGSWQPAGTAVDRNGEKAFPVKRNVQSKVNFFLVPDKNWVAAAGGEGVRGAFVNDLFSPQNICPHARLNIRGGGGGRSGMRKRFVFSSKYLSSRTSEHSVCIPSPPPQNGKGMVSDQVVYVGGIPVVTFGHGYPATGGAENAALERSPEVSYAEYEKLFENSKRIVLNDMRMGWDIWNIDWVSNLCRARPEL